ncbi:MAG TPA: tetratricopeptide repeat protein [Bryobacteraceae bacterium]|nr:tetratricopeptide repeat protein [Bryobacteraceae bacterium]
MSSTRQKARGHATAVTATATLKPAQEARLWHYGVGLTLAFFVLLTIYGPALHGPFLMDDRYQPYTLGSFIGAPLSQWLRGPRPLLEFTYWLNYAAGDQNTYPYHFVNVILHLLNGLWIYFILRKLLDWAGTAKWPREMTAVFCAGLFWCHPLQTESVSYIASRSETLSVFFLLTAYTVFLYRKPTAISWLAAAAVLVLFGAAVLSKEHTAVLIALLLLTDFYWNPAFSIQGIRNNWRLYIPFLAAAALGGWFIFRILSAAKTAGFGVMPWYEYFFSQCRAIWVYVRLFVLPFGQNLDPDFPVSHSVVEHGAIVGLLALVACAVAAWIWRRRYPLASFGFFTFLLLLAPTSSFVPIADLMAERRMYLPFIGALLIVAEFVRRWKASRNVVIGSLAGILFVEGFLTWQRNQLYADSVAIWKDTVEKSPKKSRPGFQLAQAYYEESRFSEAASEYARTAPLGKPDDGLLINWGLALDEMGDRNQALEKMKEAAALNPTAHVYSQMTKVYAEMQNYSAAAAATEQSLKIDPNFALSYYYRGNLDLVQGDTARAVQDYNHALELDPHLQFARDALSRIQH